MFNEDNIKQYQTMDINSSLTFNCGIKMGINNLSAFNRGVSNNTRQKQSVDIYLAEIKHH